MNDVWQAPKHDGAPPVTGFDGGSTDPMDVPRAVFGDLKEHLFGYLLVSLSYLGFVTVYAVAVVAAAAMLVLPGALTEDDTLAGIGLALGMIVYVGGIFALAFVGVPPLMASTMRAIDRHRTGGPSVGVFDLFTAMRPNLGRVIGFYLLQNLLIIVGMLFFYIPGLIAAALCSFAFPIVVFEDVGPSEALSLAFNHMRERGSWHVMVWLLLLVTVIVCELTVVGLLVVWPVMMAWQVFAYRLAFGEAGASGRPLR